MVTDIVDFSAKMQRDEMRTIAQTRTDLELIAKRCVQHGGEVSNTTGDGLLMCFSTAIDAVSCALRIQLGFATRRHTQRPNEMLEHRIGLHLGDVILQKTGGVAGDTVNIAVRLERKAPVGGICISQVVYDSVKGKIPLQAVFVGRQQLENILDPIPIWHITAEGVPLLTRPLPAASTKSHTRPMSLPRLIRDTE